MFAPHPTPRPPAQPGARLGSLGPHQTSRAHADSPRPPIVQSSHPRPLPACPSRGKPERAWPRPSPLLPPPPRPPPPESPHVVRVMTSSPWLPWRTSEEHSCLCNTPPPPTPGRALSAGGRSPPPRGPLVAEGLPACTQSSASASSRAFCGQRGAGSRFVRLRERALGRALAPTEPLHSARERPAPEADRNPVPSQVPRAGLLAGVGGGGRQGTGTKEPRAAGSVGSDPGSAIQELRKPFPPTPDPRPAHRNEEQANAGRRVSITDMQHLLCTRRVQLATFSTRSLNTEHQVPTLRRAGWLRPRVTSSAGAGPGMRPTAWCR